MYPKSKILAPKNRPLFCGRVTIFLLILTWLGGLPIWGGPHDCRSLEQASERDKTGAKPSWELPAEPTFNAEDGSADLSIIRLNANTSKEGLELFKLSLKDAVQALNQMPGLQLWVVTTVDSRDHILSLVTGFPANIKNRIKVLSSATAEPFDPFGFDMMEESSSFQLDPWGRDDSISIDADNILLPAQYTGMDAKQNMQRRVAASILGHNDVTLHHATLSFDGGDIIVGQAHVFIGSPTIERNITLQKGTRDKIIQQFAALFQRKVIEIGTPNEKLPSDASATQPLTFQAVDFHVDLTVFPLVDRPTGQQIVLVSSPQKTLDLLQHEPHHPLRQYLEQNGNRQRMAQRQLVIQALQQNNLRVIEMPAVIYRGRFERGGGVSMINYTNLIVSKNHVLLPHFDIPVLDQYAAKIIQTLGYQVIPMPSAKRSFCFNGGPHCTFASIFR